MFKFWVLFLVAEAARVFLIVSGFAIDMNSISAASMTATAPARELMVQEGSNIQKKIYNENINLEDYSPVDPVPSSSAAITAGPIEHRTPFVPYIPKLTPPHGPQHNGSPSPV